MEKDGTIRRNAGKVGSNSWKHDGHMETWGENSDCTIDGGLTNMGDSPISIPSGKLR